MARIIVLGAGVVGLTTAMLLAEDGNDVIVLERDATVPATSPDEAWFDWERKGVNQFRLPHFFLARYRSIVDAELPRLATSITDAGGRRMNVLLDIPESIRGATKPGDDDLEVLTGRRPVMEMAVANAAAATPHLEVRRGAVVEGLLTGPSASSGVPHVIGVRTDTGEVLGDLVVDLMGRRSSLPRLLEDIGARPPTEELEDSGFMYFGRHFRSTDGSTPFSFGPALADVGTISTLTLPADNGTWGVALVTASKDKALHGLRDVDRWDATVRACPLIAHWLDGEHLDDRVTTMSKIEDRIRDYVVHGEPVATGVISIGDAWACSNPTHGRGVSIGTLHATVLREVLGKVGLGDPRALALAVHEETAARVRPWFVWTRFQDRHRLAEIDAAIAGEEYRPDDERFELEQSLGNAATKDADLLRATIRSAMVLDPLDDLLSDPTKVAHVRELGANWREEPTPGPTRDELIALATG